MSPKGAVTLALVAFILLASFAAWLVNIPFWAILAFAVAGGLLLRRLVRRISRSRARQDTEAHR